MSRIYWDTMLFIYWLEDSPQFAKRVGTIRSRMGERNDQLITSCFTMGELLAGVYRKGASEQAQSIRKELERAVSELVPFTAETADLYAQIRGRMGVPPADAIQLASAAWAKADLFLTNDKNLIGKIVPGIQFVAGLDSNLF